MPGKRLRNLCVNRDSNQVLSRGKRENVVKYNASSNCRNLSVNRIKYTSPIAVLSALLTSTDRDDVI